MHRLAALLGFAAVASAQYLIGAGIADVTGPAAEVNLMVRRRRRIHLEYACVLVLCYPHAARLCVL